MDSERQTVATLLEELVGDIHAVLPEDAVGIYLYGSYVSGGFDPGVSDLDLVTVLARSPEEVDLAALDGMHTEFAHRHPVWRDRIETVYVGAGALGSFRTSR